MIAFRVVRHLLIVAAFCLAAVSVARAEEKPSGIPPVLEKLKQSGSVVEFMGNLYGLDGWLVHGKDGAAQYAYTTAEGGLLLGVLFRPDGTNATAEQVKALKARAEGGQNALPGAEKSVAAATKVEQLYAAVEKAAWAAVGAKEAPYLYVFMNTDCEHCHKLWSDLAPALQGGQIQVRLIPFGKVQRNREGGAALLSVDDPKLSWDLHIKGDKEALAPAKIKPGMLDRVDANTALYDSWKLAGVPFTLYRKPATGEIMALPGVPSNIMLVLADLMPAK